MQFSPRDDSGADQLLVSDADRDQISAVLGEHMAEGRLTTDELDERLGRLFASRTRGEAASVLGGLPALEPPEPVHHFHIGHEDEQTGPSLPDWLTAGPAIESPPDVEPRAAPSAPPAPGSRAEERAAARKRAKLRVDENAIGHAFQSRRRSITDALAAANAAGDHDRADRLGAELREAKETAASARRAVAAGDRAEVQRLLARLRAHEL